VSYPRRAWTTSELTKMEQMAGDGLSISKTARLLERSPASVAIQASKYEISFHGKGGAPKGNANRRGRAWAEQQREAAD